MLKAIVALFCLVFTLHCRNYRAGKSAFLDDTVEPSQQIEVSPPFAAGEFQELKWEVRFNFPDCEHEGHAKNAWCTFEDQFAAAKKSGIEDRMVQWIWDPQIKSVTLAFFSFSNKRIRQALCDAALQRGLKVRVYLHSQNLPTVPDLQTCAPELVQVIGRGKEFGTEGGYLAHAKIFLASESENPLPLSMIADATERGGIQDSKIYFTSASANLSSNGTSLHMDNWIVFESKYSHRLAQENLCFLYAIDKMQLGESNAERLSLAQINQDCRNQITAPEIAEAVFYPVPHGGITPKPFPKLIDIINSATTSVKIAIHRLTTTKLSNKLAAKANSGVSVAINYDDDTFRASKCESGSIVDIAADDVFSMRILKDAGVDIAVLETNGDVGQLHHSKYLIADDKVLFQGAGNFTATSFNEPSFGNIEYFYIFKDPNLVKAYVDGWNYARSVATTLADHPIAGNTDRGVKILPNGRKVFDETSCQTVVDPVVNPVINPVVTPDVAPVEPVEPN